MNDAIAEDLQILSKWVEVFPGVRELQVWNCGYGTIPWSVSGREIRFTAEVTIATGYGETLRHAVHDLRKKLERLV